MACEHKRLKSVNCVLYCADCGAKIEKPKEESRAPITHEMEPEKKPVKRTTKKKTEA